MAKKEYSNNEVTIVWQPTLCTHSANCVHGLGKVFDPDRKPWIDLSQASSEAIVQQVSLCPSGALSIKDLQSAPNTDAVKVQLMAGGPLVLKGSCTVMDEKGNSQIHKSVAFCRCTKSANLPYCDGSHKN